MRHATCLLHLIDLYNLSFKVSTCKQVETNLGLEKSDFDKMSSFSKNKNEWNKKHSLEADFVHVHTSYKIVWQYRSARYHLFSEFSRLFHKINTK